MQSFKEYLNEVKTTEFQDENLRTAIEDKTQIQPFNMANLVGTEYEIKTDGLTVGEIPGVTGSFTFGPEDLEKMGVSSYNDLATALERNAKYYEDPTQ